MDRDLSQIDIRTALLAVTDLILPRVCVICGKSLSVEDRHICQDCLKDLPRTRFALLPHNPMADKLNALLDYDHYEPYSFAAALFYYSSPAGKTSDVTLWRDNDATYGRITQSLKYERNFGEGRFFGKMLGNELAKAAQFQDVDGIVPVPLHWTRWWKRGYNQAEIIARALASSFPNAKVNCRLLKRQRATKSQARTNSSQSRVANVSGAFVADTGSSSYKHILIVDDVFTTGNTLAQCHKALRAALGPGVRISVATLAYAGF